MSYVGVNQYLVEILGEGEHERSNLVYFFERGYKGIIISPDSTHPFAKNHDVLQSNIVPLLKTYKVPKQFDCLSIDLNGNDYWILEQVLQHFRPSLIVCEFNCSREACETIQYSDNHKWQGDDYFGFSFAAGKQLAEKHGYYIVFQNDDLNLYMIANELIEGDIQTCSFNKHYWFAHNANGIWQRV